MALHTVLSIPMASRSTVLRQEDFQAATQVTTEGAFHVQTHVCVCPAGPPPPTRATARLPWPLTFNLRNQYFSSSQPASGALTDPVAVVSRGLQGHEQHRQASQLSTECPPGLFSSAMTSISDH